MEEAKATHEDKIAEIHSEHHEKAPITINSWKDLYIFGPEDHHLSFDRLDLLKKSIEGFQVNIEKKDIVELKSMPKPPVVVKNVLGGVLAAFGKTDLSWKSIKSFLAQSDIVSLFLHYDKDHLEYKACKKINRQIKDLNSAMVAKVNLGTVGLYNWLKSIVNYRVYLALTNNKPVLVRRDSPKRRSPTREVHSRPQTVHNVTSIFREEERVGNYKLIETPSIHSENARRSRSPIRDQQEGDQEIDQANRGSWEDLMIIENDEELSGPDKAKSLKEILENDKVDL